MGDGVSDSVWAGNGQKSAFRSVFGEQADRKALEMEQERRCIEDARADHAALVALADMSVPADIRDWAKRHKMPELTAMVWRHAFILGWRSRQRAIEKPRSGADEPAEQ